MFARGVPERQAIAQMQWLDREGKALGTVGDVQSYSSLRISNQGTRVATSIGEPGEIWIHDLGRDTTTRFTFDPGSDTGPIWSPDGRVAALTAVRPRTGADIELYGVAQHLPLGDSSPALEPSDWSPDGRVAALTAVRPKTGADIELYVTAYPDPGGKWQVSSGGGELAIWRADGRELYYISSDHVMAVPVETGEAFRNDTPVALFELPDIVRVDWIDQIYDAAPDGERFLFLMPREDTAPGKGTVTLVQGWRGLVE